MEERSSFGSRRHHLNLKEWSLRIRRENTNPSTASSPGYTIREEIDPSTYSFTTALKALQAKTMYRWEYLSADGLRLNSKWDDAEKYICNPLSGEVPLECLSRISIYPCHMKSSPLIQHKEDEAKITIQENDVERERITTRDVGIQSTPSGSPSPVRTPSTGERSVKHSDTDTETGDSTRKLKSEAEVQVKERRERKRGNERRKAVICMCGLFKTKKKQQ